MCGIWEHGSKGVFWPLMAIGAGVLFLLQNLGLLPPDTWRYWPIILVVIGLMGLAEGTARRKRK